MKARLGSVKTPKQVEAWQDLPRSKVGKILKNEVKARLSQPGPFLSRASHPQTGQSGHQNVRK